MEEALSYYDLTGQICWQIEKSEKERIFKYDGTDAVEARQKLEQALATLPGGTYKLKVWKAKNGESGMLQSPFKIASTHTEQLTKPTMVPTDWQAELEKARLAGFKEGHEKATIENRITALEKDVTDIKKVLYELTNEDTSDDKTAFEQIRDFSAAVPDFMNGFKALKSA